MAVEQLSQDELDEIYAFAIDLGRKAGDMLMERVEQRISGGNGPQTFEEKENAVDIVTQTDEGKLSMQRDVWFIRTRLD
jgi:myo-inositol-1(or 4)-monophosphatase